MSNEIKEMHLGMDSLNDGKLLGRGTIIEKSGTENKELGVGFFRAAHGNATLAPGVIGSALNLSATNQSSKFSSSELTSSRSVYISLSHIQLHFFLYYIGVNLAV